MGTGVTFSISSFIFALLLLIVYFSKKRLFLVENKIYVVMLVTLIFVLVFEIGCFWAGMYIDIYPFLSEMLLKIYLIAISFFSTVFSIYIFSITCKIKDLNSAKFKKKLETFLIMWGIPFIIVLFLVLLLPMEVIIDRDSRYSSGPSVNLVYFYITISLITWTIRMIIRRKNLDKIKIIPIITFIALSIIGFLIQTNYPGIILTGTISAVICVIMFYTVENPDLKNLNEMRLAKDDAEKANNAKSDFLSNMSHEIRTPLNAVVSYSREILEAQDLNSAKKDAYEVIKASEILLDIIGGILDISKIESGKIEIEESSYNSHDLFSSVSRLINVKMQEKNLTFNVNIAKDLPPFLIGDKSNIQKILINLLSNSYKYTREGKVDFTVDCINKNNTSRLIISVQDTGRGIKSEDIDKLFSKFSRIDTDRNTTTEGTGLGLAITKMLVELMNGKITVQSTYGSGSRFTVILDQKIDPIVVSEDDLLKTQAINFTEELKNTLNKEKILLDYKGKEILVIDDNPTNLKIAVRLLEKYNLVVSTVLSGEDALEKDVSNFDLIILDIEMPGLKGTEVLKFFREREIKTPIIAWTANATTGDKEKYLDAGFDDYLTKPVEREKLDETLSKYLN